jgi:glutathione S-transferase
MSSRNKFNPFSNMFGDVASSILGQKSAASPSDPNLDATLASLSNSWDGVRSTLASLQTPEERTFRETLSTGRGPPSPLHKVRLFYDSDEEKDVRVTFFRDSASWCPYCQKVWMTLEEKRIPYRIEKINMRCYGEKPSSFARIQPSGQIPVAIIDGRTYGQSNEIMYAVEELFPQSTSLRPPKGQEGTAQELLRLERRIFSAWMYWLTGSGNDAQRRADFCSVLSEVESALQQSGAAFFMGKDVTLVDFMFAPFLERMAASLLFFKGFTMRVPPNTPTDYPCLNKWFDGMETLDSYRLTKSDYYTHCWDLPPQLGGCTYEPAGEPYEKAINGVRSLDGTQGSWELPIQPHNGGVEPDWSWAGDEEAAKREAVERLSANHEAIVAFAARGAGRKGMPPYSAMLADPNAVPNENVKNGISAVLQTVSMALLQGVEQHESGMTKMADAIVQEGGSDYADGIVASLTYLRDRVGVPRDMRLPAARQLRAHLNWAIGKLLSAQG